MAGLQCGAMAMILLLLTRLLGYAVAISYLLHKTPYVFPIVGGRKVEQLLQNIEALEISLTKEQITYLESVTPFDPGFPATMIVSYLVIILGEWRRFG